MARLNRHGRSNGSAWPSRMSAVVRRMRRLARRAVGR
jgi:hypothetical protein